MNKKLLFGLGLSPIVFAPVATVISCSNDKPTDNIYNGESNDIPGFDSSAKNKLDKILSEKEKPNDNYSLEGSYEIVSKLLKTVQERLKSDNFEEKTLEEVQQIAKEEMNNLTTNQIKELLWNSFNLASWKSLTFSWINDKNKEAGKLEIFTQVLYDIKDVEFNKENQTISFKVQLFSSGYNKLIKPNYKYDQSILEIYKFENIKIESDVFKKNKKLVPIIKFSKVQENASLSLESYKVNGDSSQLKQCLEYTFDNSEDKNQLGSKDKYIQVGLESSIDKLISRFEKPLKLGKTLGQENGKFKIQNNYKDDEYTGRWSSSWSNFGYEFKIGGEAEATTLEMNYPIAYLTMDNNSIDLKVYKEKN